MYLKARLFQVGEPSWSGDVHEGATLADVLAAAGASVGTKALSQNGVRATPDTPVRENATVMLSPAARHG